MKNTYLKFATYLAVAAIILGAAGCSDKSDDANAAQNGVAAVRKAKEITPEMFEGTWEMEHTGNGIGAAENVIIVIANGRITMSSNVRAIDKDLKEYKNVPYTFVRYDKDGVIFFEVSDTNSNGEVRKDSKGVIVKRPAFAFGLYQRDRFLVNPKKANFAKIFCLSGYSTKDEFSFTKREN